jgi:hypothetical protein
MNKTARNGHNPSRRFAICWMMFRPLTRVKKPTKGTATALGPEAHSKAKLPCIPTSRSFLSPTDGLNALRFVFLCLHEGFWSSALRVNHRSGQG